MEKKFLTYDQQIEKLQNEKQLTITDVPTAIHTLEHISYYSLIGGYKNLFIHKPSGKYLYGVTFGQLSAFYQYMPNDVQVKVSKHFPDYTEKQLHQFITIIAKCRNVCAHGEP